jgi:glycosyltransferase involved in cell wall biosynthesis
VSVTPLSVETDSRTFKIAASARRLEYESIVVEGQPSTLAAASLPFEVRAPAATVKPTRSGSAPGDPVAGAAAAAPAAPAAGVARRLFECLLFPLRLAKFSLDTGRAIPPASLYYLHSFEQFPAVWFKALRFRVPYVYDAHDMYSVLRYDGRPRPFDVRFQEQIRNALERFCVRRAAGFVTVGDGVAELEWRAFGRRPLVIRNAHDARLDADGGSDVRSACGLGPDAFLLAISGNLKRGMAIAELLEAMLGLPEDVHLALVGAGYDALDSEIAERGLGARVHRFAAVAPTQIVPFLRSADLAPVIYRPLTANLANALPNGFFHALGAGLPVLYPTDLPELRSIIEGHDCGVPVDPSDPGSVRAAVQRLRGDDEELARLRAAARRAGATLSWEREEVSLARLFAGLVPDRGRA